MKPLNERTDAELTAAIEQIEKIEANVAEDSRKMPGPGWAAVIEILERDRNELQSELQRRLQK